MTDRDRAMVEQLCAELRAACEHLPEDTEPALIFAPESDVDEPAP